MRAIAEQTGRRPSTISRELRRNRDPDSGQYRPFTAHKLAMQWRARPRPGKIAADPVLRRFVVGRLEKRWSAQEVSRALPGEFPGERARHVVHETIYQVVYGPELGGLPRERPARVLRTRRRRRRPHRRPDERRPNGIIAMTMIGRPVLCQNSTHGLTCCFTIGARAYPPHLPVHGPRVRLAGAPGAQ